MDQKLGLRRSIFGFILDQIKKQSMKYQVLFAWNHLELVQIGSKWSLVCRSQSGARFLKVLRNFYTQKATGAQKVSGALEKQAPGPISG